MASQWRCAQGENESLGHTHAQFSLMVGSFSFGGWNGLLDFSYSTDVGARAICGSGRSQPLLLWGEVPTACRTSSYSAGFRGTRPGQSVSDMAAPQALLRGAAALPRWHSEAQATASPGRFADSCTPAMTKAKKTRKFAEVKR